jgi:hypothetical protein
MHDWIAITAAKKYLMQSIAQFFVKCLIYNKSTQVTQRHTSVDTNAVVVTWTLWTSGITVAGNF